MQYKIYKILNSLLLMIIAVILLLVGGYFLMRAHQPDYLKVYIFSALVVTVVLLSVFKWLESRWDKKVIEKMARNGKIALADIHGAERVMVLRETNFNKYWLYKFDATIYDREGNKIDGKPFYEKMNCATEQIPAGTVWITWDEAKPNQIFVIPNVIISHLPSLAATVLKYESNKKIPIKYLDVYYNEGMVIRSFRESVKEIKSEVKKNAKKAK